MSSRPKKRLTRKRQAVAVPPDRAKQVSKRSRPTRPSPESSSSYSLRSSARTLMKTLECGGQRFHLSRIAISDAGDRVRDISFFFDHVSKVFGRDPAYFRDHVVHDPSPLVIFTAELEHNSATDTDGQLLQDSQIVACVRICERSVRTRAGWLRAGGICDVATKEAYRGKGLAKNLLALAVQYIREHGMPLSTLHSRRASDMYAQLGWMRVPVNFVVVPLEDLEQVTAQAIKRLEAQPELCVTPLEAWVGTAPNPDAAFDQLFAVLQVAYQQSCAFFVGGFRRSHLGYWQGWVRREWTAPTTRTFLLTQKDGSQQTPMPRGLVALRPGKGDIAVLELILTGDALALPPQRDFSEADFLWVCLRKALNQRRWQEEKTLSLPAPLYARFRAADCPPSTTSHVDTGRMYRVLDPERVSKALAAGSVGTSADVDARPREKANGTGTCDQNAGACAPGLVEQLFSPEQHVFWLTDAF